MSSVDELLQAMSESDYLLDEVQFVIDENLRTIQIPPNGVVLGVRGDKDVNRINFQMSRYYNGFDMYEFLVRIEFHNAVDQKGFYNVNDLTVDEDLIRFTWLVGKEACSETGTVQFQVYMFKFDENNEIIEQAFRSTINTANVLEKLDDDAEDIPTEEVRDIIGQLQGDIERAKRYVDGVKTHVDAVDGSFTSKVTQANNNLEDKVTQATQTLQSTIQEAEQLLDKMIKSLVVVDDLEAVNEGTSIFIHDTGDVMESPDMKEFNTLKESVGNRITTEEIDDVFREDL